MQLGVGELVGLSITRLEVTNNLYETISMMPSRGHWMLVKKLDCFEPRYTVWSIGTHLPGVNQRKIELRI